MRLLVVLACAACAAPPRGDLAVPPAPGAATWVRGDRVRVEVDEGKGKDVTTVLIAAPSPLAVVAMVDKRVPDAEHAVGTSCAAPADGAGVACALAAHRLAALDDLARGAPAALALDLIGAGATASHADVDAALDGDRTVYAVTADGARAGRPIHLHGRVTIDRARTRAVGDVHGTDGGAPLEVFFDLGPAD